MKCGECGNIRWFGDYALHYCDKTKDVVTPDKECTEVNSDDRVSSKNFSKNKKDE